MRLTYIAAVALAAVFASSAAVSTAGDPQPAPESDVSFVNRVTDGARHTADTKRLLRARAEDDSAPMKAREAAGNNNVGAANNMVKPMPSGSNRNSMLPQVNGGVMTAKDKLRTEWALFGPRLGAVADDLMAKAKPLLAKLDGRPLALNFKNAVLRYINGIRNMKFSDYAKWMGVGKPT
ncbi:unnamed protein product [Hyaloperonospora brassicae]|uniref:RxLR effector protein n=1 Tax=Hyaloperonospora brassicae TaxID=162125 RepID=A0AAV0T5B8_HYABA|nr:unnamed protein product [Hyaloperonospora brassicae]